MKSIRWLGVAIFSSAAVIAAVLLIGQAGEAAPGDPIVTLGINERVLTAGQRNCYVTWITSVLPRAQPANLVRLDCSTAAGKTQCTITDRRTLTAAQYAAAEAEGRLSRFLPDTADIAADGSTVTITHQSDERELTPAQATSLEACHAPVFGTTALASFYLKKEGAQTSGAAVEVKAITPVQRLLDIRNGVDSQRVGTVVP